MRQTIFLLLTLITLNVSAYTVKRSEKGGNNQFGLVDVRSSVQVAGIPSIVVLFGIGEKGNGTTDLAKIERLANFKEICQSADAFKFNFVAVQTSSSYQYGEINYAIDYAINHQGADMNKVYCITMSNGGYGYARAVDKDANLPKRFAGVAQIVMGPGELPKSAFNIAQSKTPHWFFVTADDNVTPPANTINLYNKAKLLGGNVYLTKWNKGGHGVMGRVVGSWGNVKPLNWAPCTCNPSDKYGATDLCDPAYENVYLWFFANVRGEQVYSPTQLPEPVKPAQPAPAPPPVDNNATLTGINISPDYKNNSFFVDMFYSDGSKESFKPAAGNLIKNTWINLKADPKITITFQERSEFRDRFRQ